MQSVLLPILSACFLIASSEAAVRELKTDQINLQLDDETGKYTIVRASPRQEWSGSLNQPLVRVQKGIGEDRIGKFEKIDFAWHGRAYTYATIQVYKDEPLVLFSTRYEQTLDKPDADFPNFTSIPAGQHVFSYSNKTFAVPQFEAVQETGSPFVIFDDAANAMIISPAANFMTAALHGDGKTSVSSGFVPQLQNLPQNFVHRTLVAFDKGIGTTFDTWGIGLQTLLGAVRPTNDADAGLKYLGYWTDNKATYYYNYDEEKGYAGTLLAVADELQRLNIRIGYMQLDSWWYHKTATNYDGKEGNSKKNAKLPEATWNKYGGLLEWTAHPDLFPEGLLSFQQKLGLPLITHNRWVDLKSPYREKFRISGVGAVDPKWWDQIADYCKANNIVIYEQDWLDRIYDNSPEFKSTPDKGEAYMDNMARATQQRGITMQYCMTLPRHYLQGVKYNNLTTVRVSTDGFGRARWEPALYVSALAGALDEWPWVDVFMSRQTPNLLIANLTAGMVGIGDALGQFDTENLSRVARADGVLVKPDRPITPIDATFIADAKQQSAPMIASTYSQHGEHRTAYVFAYQRKADQSDFHFTAEDLGLKGDVWVYDWKSRSGKKLAAGETYAGTFEVKANPGTGDPPWSYCVVAPISAKGIALIGDPAKFVTAGKQRIEKIEESSEGLSVTIAFAPGEKSVTLHGFAPLAPLAILSEGKTEESTFDKASSHFEIRIAPPENADHVTVKLSQNW